MPKKPAKKKAETFRPNAKQKAVLACVRRYDPRIGAGSGDVARACKISQKEAIAHLAVLENAGLVTHRRAIWSAVKTAGDKS